MGFYIVTLFCLISMAMAVEETTAVPVELEAKCKMPVDKGIGDENEERFFFDNATQSCKSFNYTGAGGNENNFFSELECLNDCFIGVVNDHSKDQSEEDVVLLSQNATQPLIDAAVEEYPCSKPKHNGDGKETHQKFYYNDSYKTCFAFKYKGSGGNNNRFDSHSECMGTCGLDCDESERKAISECEKFLSKVEIAQKIGTKTASKTMIKSVVSLLKEFNSACALFDEYKTCMSLVTKNAGCLDPTYAVKEQILNFVCQENVKAAMVGDEGACVEKVAESQTIKDCETKLDNDKSVCDMLDDTLNCTMPEMAACGSTTISFITNIVKTIRNAEDCDNESNSDESVEVSTHLTLPLDTVLENPINLAPNRPHKNRRGRRNRHKPSRPNGSSSSDCPPTINAQTISICLPLLSSKSVKNALSGSPGAFVFSDITAQNVRFFCSQSKLYRKCVETIYTSIEACTQKLNDDAFYSFILSVYDDLCQDSKQFNFLVNAGCLHEITSKSSVQRCLLRNSFSDGRTLCKAYQQFDNCVIDSISETCRDAEIKYFESLFDNLSSRQHLCTNSVSLVERPPPDDDQNDDNDEDAEADFEPDDNESASKISAPRRPSTRYNGANTRSDCNLRRQLALIRGSSFVPKCEDNGHYSSMQCDRKSGTCFCVDTETGEVTPASVTGPGKPLPLCGLKSLFTCDRLPEKLFCEIDVTLSQKTERWYRRGNRCVKYLYDYCPASAHIAPIPLRSLTDCKRFCLPSY